MDLEEASDVNEEELLAAHEKLFSLGRESLKPIVMAVNGPALGGGLGLAAQSHLLYASDVATFGLPEIRVGLWPFVVYRSLSAAIGRRRVLALSLTGDYFNSSHAHEWGFVHHVSAPIEVEDHAAAMARHLARASPEAIASGLQYVREAHDKLWTEAGETAAQARRRLMATEDFAEGRLAFKQKRSPRWPSMPPDFYASK
jgi:enoyl-CoA hydratase/carnithine racemase